MQIIRLQKQFTHVSQDGRFEADLVVRTQIRKPFSHQPNEPNSDVKIGFAPKTLAWGARPNSLVLISLKSQCVQCGHLMSTCQLKNKTKKNRLGIVTCMTFKQEKDHVRDVL